MLNVMDIVCTCMMKSSTERVICQLFDGPCCHGHLMEHLLLYIFIKDHHVECERYYIFYEKIKGESYSPGEPLPSWSRIENDKILMFAL